MGRVPHSALSMLFIDNSDLPTEQINLLEFERLLSLSFFVLIHFFRHGPFAPLLQRLPGNFELLGLTPVRANSVYEKGKAINPIWAIKRLGADWCACRCTSLS